jgi:ankyrin repeat protein
MGVIGNPPLHLAFMLGNADIARLLLGKRAYDVLMFQLFLDYGASGNSVNRNNWTAMDEAIW